MPSSRTVSVLFNPAMPPETVRAATAPPLAPPVPASVMAPYLSLDRCARLIVFTVEVSAVGDEAEPIELEQLVFGDHRRF